jgi:formate/nitrite transporter FocA (FNT family)
VSAGLGLESDPVEIRFGFPWRFLLFVIIGSIIGGVLRTIRGERRQVVRFMVEAVLTGVLVAIAYVIGINVIGLFNVAVPPVLDEALVLTLAALGAYFGLPRFGREAEIQPTG